MEVCRGCKINFTISLCAGVGCLYMKAIRIIRFRIWKRVECMSVYVVS